MLATVNDTIELRFCVSRDLSMRLVNNQVWTWKQLRERLARSDADKLTLAEFKSRSKDWQATRKNNGYFIGAQFKGGIRHKVNARPRSLITFDIDQGTERLLKSLRDGTSGLGPIEYVVYSTRTHGDGTIKLRVVIPLPKLLPEEQFVPLSRILAEALDPLMKAVDPVSFKNSQLMYWPSHCADIEPVFIHHQGMMIDPGDVLETWSKSWGDWQDIGNLPRSEREQLRLRAEVEKSGNPLEKRGVIGAFCNEWDIHEAIIEFDLPYEPSEVGADGVPTRYSFKDGTSSNGMVVYDEGLKAHSHHSTDPLGDTNFNAYDMTRVHLFGHLDGARETDEDPRKMRSYIAMEKMLLEKYPQITARLRDSNYGISPDDIDESFEAEDPDETEEVTSEAEEQIAEDDDWRESLDVTEKGIIKSNIANIVLILRNATHFKGRFGYNEFTHTKCLVKSLRSKALKVDCRLPKGETVMQIEDYHYAAIRMILEAQRGKAKSGWGLRVTQTDLREAVLTVCRENGFHPVRDYLSEVEPLWDGTKRMETMWTKACHTPDTPYYRQSSRLLLTAAVARVYEPGCKFDFMPVLIGPQGLRKSTFVMILGSPKWSGETEGHFDDKKKFVEASQGYWFLENGEMTHFRRAQDDDAIKAMLSGTVDNVRLSYREDPARYARQFVIIGTTNAVNFLRDRHRRIWPIVCGPGQVDTEWLETNRDQLFAEAVHEYRRMRRESNSGILPLYLTGEAAEEHGERQGGHLIETDTEAKAGLVHDWLEISVPLGQSQPGADLGDKTDDAFAEEELTLRTRTCAVEIFERVLGGDVARYDMRAARSVGDIMRNLQPEWMPGPYNRCGKYGRQRTYFRAVLPSI